MEDVRRKRAYNYDRDVRAQRAKEDADAMKDALGINCGSGFRFREGSCIPDTFSSQVSGLLRCSPARGSGASLSTTDRAVAALRPPCRIDSESLS